MGRVELLRGVCLFAFLGLAAAPAGWATPYWIAWEGDDFPENQGWTRSWGNWDGLHQGPGAIRTLENGVLTYDSLYDAGVWDTCSIERPGEMDPDPGEIFVCEWRLRVREVTSVYGDPAVVAISDDAWGVAFDYAEDHIRGGYGEGWLSIPIVPYVWHDYRLLSSDMRAYDLYIDDQLVRHGGFTHVVTPSVCGFGDMAQGVASLHDWDYYRFGVIPEPAALFLAMWAVAWQRARRSQT